MRVCTLILGMSLLFGEVSAGGSVSRIATGAVVGVLTGGVGALLPTVTATQAITSGVVAGVATAAGAKTTVGVGCDGNGNNPHIEVNFKNKEGRNFEFRSDNVDNKQPQAPKSPESKGQENIQKQIEKEYEETVYKRELHEDLNFVFNASIGWKTSKLTSKDKSFDCISNGNRKILAESNTRKWKIGGPLIKYDSVTTFSPENEDGQQAVKHFVFEETPLIWHFDRQNINGQWFNHAWTDTSLDVLVPDTVKASIRAPHWYREKKRNEEQARLDKELKVKTEQKTAKGFLEEFLWSNVKAVNSINKKDWELGRASVNQGLSYYDYAMKTYLDPSLNCFSDRGMATIKDFSAGKIDGQQFLDDLKKDFEEMLETASISSNIGTVVGAVAGGAITKTPAGVSAGANLGNRAGTAVGFAGSTVYQMLKKVLNVQPKYAYNGAPGANFKNFTNFKKAPLNPRNVKGSSGSGKTPNASKEPKMREVKDGERLSSTRKDADDYINGLKKCGKLSNKQITKDKHEYYKVMEKIEYKGVKFKKGDYISRDELHHEWEWFRGKDSHQGAIDSITGKLYKAAESDRTLKLP